MLSIVHACALLGIDGYMVDVEVDFNPRAGLPSFNIVGLPDSALKESRERVGQRFVIPDFSFRTANQKSTLIIFQELLIS